MSQKQSGVKLGARVCRCWGILLLVVSAPVWVLPGCAPSGVSDDALPGSPDATSVDQLRSRLDDVLEFTYADRDLDLEQHAAWQILHGVLAYQQDFLVRREGQLVSAVDHLLGGGSMKGWTVQVVARPGGERGLRAALEEGSQTGQGHADQWLAILAQCDLPVGQPIRVGGQTLTMRDFVAQVQWDVPRNFEREFSWTLIGLTHYLPTESSWTASDGRTWSIEQLVRIEAQQELGSSACGGTHRLIGLTMALDRHLANGGQLTGGWVLAEGVIADALQQAQRLQNGDGSFSTRYFQGPGSSPDLAQNLGTTGHILEFLVLALDGEQLRQVWIQRAVAYLCDLFEATRQVPLECGALYHAAHALVLYRQKAYVERASAR